MPEDPNIDRERLQELAALDALGILEPVEAAELLLARSQSPTAYLAEAKAFSAVVEAWASALPRRTPPSELKDRILVRLPQSDLAGTPPPPLPPEDTALEPEFRRIAASDAGWVPMKVPGAYYKLLSIEKQSGYAVLLGKLDPGCHYPAHAHAGPENIYMLSGDLRLGEHLVRAGDFHRSAAGTSHADNYSETGCTLLMVISLKNLAAAL
jgi:quercetin dioxygenase-like cupin family protein